MWFARGKVRNHPPPSHATSICNGSFTHVCHEMLFLSDSPNRFHYLWRASETTETKITFKGTRCLHHIQCNGWNRCSSWSSSTLRVANRRISCPVSVAECSEGCLPIVHCLGDHRRPCCLFNNAISVDSFAPCIIISSYMCGGDMTPNNIHWLLIMQHTLIIDYAN